ncbi:sigma-70 family RNA polymerase sigma factor [Actinocrinis puniceicyclus]|uniref:Sigma-70 family RNA polymerase sigma factor n=1 Tax=Actinocrinis puniceicyclus TaxID=977794 RepID=A0A8J7WTB9_9ACTN|nr:sigma-70 family RNA polymerase sigma factor [Actinocrinis puniceicyclus]MBS2965789.1 sigma-70 family RNA polymerase sigma factor [Actinocrinis puniceicyclus]
MVGQMDARLVTAARNGDQDCLDELVARYLPLVYNIVGRALARHGDVDDVVQETMLRVVRGLGGLRRPERFRSWLVAIAMNQVREHARNHRDTAPLDRIEQLADPGADFVDLTLAELGLSGQRRETALATRWLDPDDRHLLALWWLVTAGHLTRAELVEALDLDAHHVTVRIARMKAQLDGARLVVRALIARPRCPGLSQAAGSWRGQESPLWRKRFARHVRACTYCSSAEMDLVPAERLLAGLGLVPLPAGYAAYMLACTHGVAHTAAIATATVTTPANTGPEGRIPGRRGRHGASHRVAPHAGHIGRLATKPLLAVTALAAVAGIGLATVYAVASGHPAPAARPPRALSSSAPALAPLSSGSSPATATAATSAAASPKPSPSASAAKPGPSAAVSRKPPVTATSTAAGGTSGGGGANQSAAVQQVLDLINQARAQAGLPAYTITSGLTGSATKHNQTMSGGCGLSHQCPGEPALGARETAAGVQWTSAGENIGEGGPVSDTQAAIAQMAVGLTQGMLDEKPPNDGHRQNILSGSFHHIGIAVSRDGSGTVWMTQDFSS